MDIFNLNPDPNPDKFPKLCEWFDFMNGQMEKLEEIQNTTKLNKVLEEKQIKTVKF